jgi:hypothetical protein
MSKRGRPGDDGTPPPFDEAGAYFADSGSEDNGGGSGSEDNGDGSGSENNGGGSSSEDNGGGSGSEARVSLALPDTSSYFAVPVPAMVSGSSLFNPPPPLLRTSSCHTSSPASSMASPPLGPAFASASSSALPSLLLRLPSNQSDSSIYSPVLFKDGGSLSHAPDHAILDSPQQTDPFQLAADNVALSQRLMQLEAELRTLKPKTEQQHGNFFPPLPCPSAAAAPPLTVVSPATIGFSGVPVLDFTALLQLPPRISSAASEHNGDAALMTSVEVPFVFANARFGNEVTLLGAADEKAAVAKQQEHQPPQKPYAASVDDLRSLIKQQQKELDYFRQQHKSVVAQQGRHQLAAVEKARADSAEATAQQLQGELAVLSSALGATESALRSDTAFRSALVKHFPDLSSASAVISRIQEMQHRQLQLEADICAAKKEAAAAVAAVTSVTAQLSCANTHLQQQEQQQQALLQRLHRAEAAAAAATAAAEARVSITKMFDFETFVEVSVEWYCCPVTRDLVCRKNGKFQL